MLHNILYFIGMYLCIVALIMWLAARKNNKDIVIKYKDKDEDEWY